MQIRCASCGSNVPVADTGVLPPQCPHCKQAPVPERLGRFKVVRLLAAGGMGEVYLGEHEELGSKVALKLLPSPNGADAAAVRERFRREAKLTAAIAHPGVVQVLDLAADQGRLYLVLELVDGRSLRSRLREGPVPVAEAVRIAAAAADVLGAAHQSGVVHRDVKPENVMLCADGRVRVLDFGIARALQDQEPLTRTGELLGTPEYMAPEQLLDEAGAVDARTDVHALAVLCYELLTARSPFAGPNLFAALKLVESLVPPPPSRLRPEVPAAVDAVVLRGLAKAQADRFADGAQFAQALRAACPHAGAAAPPRGSWLLRALLIVAVVALAALVVTGIVFVRDFDAMLRDVGDKLPHAVAAVTDDALRAELEQLLGRDALAPDERQRVHAIAALIGPAASRQTQLACGRALARAGAFAAALERLDHCAQLDAAARTDAAVAWHCVHTLLPACIGAPPWFALADRVRRDRLHGLGAAEQEAAVEPLLGACRALARGDGDAAWRLLAPTASAWTPEHAVVALLAARAACADPATFAAVAARTGARFGTPAVRLAACADAAAAGERLRELAAEQDAAGADRWLLELAAAAGTATADGSAPPRLRAAAELAWLSGAGAVAPFWLCAARTAAAMRGAPLRAEEAQRLQTLYASAWSDEAPAADVARALALLPTDAAAARTVLQQAKLPDDRALGLFRAWRDAGDAPAAAIATVLRGERGRELPRSMPLPAADGVPCAFAHALAALADRQPDKQQEHWQEALSQPFDAELLLPCVAAATELLPLPALLADRAGASPLPPGFSAALRLCARAGLDLGPLRLRFLEELTHGVR